LGLREERRKQGKFGPALCKRGSLGEPREKKETGSEYLGTTIIRGDPREELKETN